MIAARKFGARELLDPRPYAKGSIKETFREYPRLEHLLPAMGYRPEQISELRECIEETPCDLVLAATPIDLTALLNLEKEVIRVGYEVEETEGDELRRSIEAFLNSA